MAFQSRDVCHHRFLRFGSGDYYIFCHDCDARWVTSDPSTDRPAPELANKGPGGQLSGKMRIAPP